MGIKERWFKCSPLPDDISQRLDKLAPFFQKKGVLLAYLFGSMTKGKGNDVDIALLYDGDFLAIREDIQEILGSWRLDIVNLRAAPVLLSFEIISTGELIYKMDAETENSFEMSIIKQYQDLKPIRDRQLRYLKENLEIDI
jgi:predicted nucleotidyltransferase